MSETGGRPETGDRKPPLLLYDGDCGFCARQIQFILRHDRNRTLRFAPLAGRTAAAILARYPELGGVDSMVWVDDPGGDGERTRLKSGAVLAVAGYLGGLWRLTAGGYIIPGVWRDALYDLVARHRHRLGADGCLVPTRDVAGRLLP